MVVRRSWLRSSKSTNRDHLWRDHRFARVALGRPGLAGGIDVVVAARPHEGNVSVFSSRRTLNMDRRRAGCWDREQLIGGKAIDAIAEGAITVDDVRTELGGVIVGMQDGRTSDEDITLFESVGVGLQDLATAELVIARARELGVGTNIDLTR